MIAAPRTVLRCRSNPLIPPLLSLIKDHINFRTRLPLQGTSSVLALLLGRTAEGAAGAPASQVALAAYACLAAASLASQCLAGPCPSSAALRRQQALAVLLRLGWITLCKAALGLVETSW